MRYRRLAKIWRQGNHAEKDFVKDLLQYQAGIHGHFRVREETWRRAEAVWFDAVKLQMDLGEDFPEPRAMFYLTGLMGYESRLEAWQRILGK